MTAAMRKSVQHLTQPRPTVPHQASGLAVPGAPAQDGSHSPSLLTGSGDAIMAHQSLGGQDDPNIDIKPNIDAFRASSPAVSGTGTGVGKAPFSNHPPLQKSVTPVPAEAMPVPLNSVDHELESGKLPLDVAVYESITQAGGDDKVKRVISNILVIGGVANMQGTGMALQSRYVPSYLTSSTTGTSLDYLIKCSLEPLLRQRFPAGPAPLVIPSNKYADPAHLAWKGIQNLCKLDIVNDMWIRADDWDL